MSIARALLEIERSTTSEEVRRARIFRARQHQLDELIGETEMLVMNGSPSAPVELRARAETTLAAVQGKFPTWLRQVESPVELLDHLLVEEGRLRQLFYRRPCHEMEDSDSDFF